MSQVTIRRPLGELDLGDQLGPKPHAVFHFFLGQSPLGSFPLWQFATDKFRVPAPLTCRLHRADNYVAVAPQAATHRQSTIGEAIASALILRLDLDQLNSFFRCASGYCT